MSQKESDFGLSAAEKEYLKKQVKETIQARLDGAALPDDVPERRFLRRSAAVL